MNENMKDGTARATARRRLIRGAFAAPVALTLYSGNVFAAASNLRALANQIAAPKYPGPVSSPTDTWIRVKVYEWTDANGANKTLVVSGAEVAQQPGCGSRFVGTAEWATVANSQKFEIQGRTPALTQAFAALRFDEKGVIVGVIPSEGSSVSGTTALTRSAGTSLVGACQVPGGFGGDGVRL